MKGSLWRGLVAAAAASVFAGVALAANTSSFADPTGDADASPDLTGISISNDDSGIVTIKLTLGNRATFGPDDAAGVGIDADQNPDTGSYFYGAEYELDLHGTELTVFRAAPDGSYAQAAAPSSFHASFAAGAVTLSFSAAEVGITSGFDVYAVGFDSDWIDTAPDIRTVNHQLVAGTARPAVAGDRRAPVDEALKSTGTHGKVAQLGYFASDGRGETADTIVVYRGKKVLKRIAYKLADTNPFLPYVARWQVPKKTRGKLRFCVFSRDRAGNKSNTSCAALTVK